MKKIVFSKEQIEDIKKLYNEYNSQASIGRKYNCSAQTIMRLLEKEGIKSRGNRKYSFNENIFDEIDTAEKAYWIGFITADGYVNEEKNFLTIKLQYRDKNHLKKIDKFNK